MVAAASRRHKVLKDYATHYAYPEGEVGMAWKDVLQDYWWDGYRETLGEPS